MKKTMHWIGTILAVSIITILLNFLIEGVPLFGTPKTENIEHIVVTHTDYPDDVKDITDEYSIELAEALLGYLHYAPLKGLTDDAPTIQITFHMKDGTEIVVKANEKTVWWNGTPRALQDEGRFVKMCTAVFYLQTN